MFIVIFTINLWYKVIKDKAQSLGGVFMIESDNQIKLWVNSIKSLFQSLTFL